MKYILSLAILLLLISVTVLILYERKTRKETEKLSDIILKKMDEKSFNCINGTCVETSGDNGVYTTLSNCQSNCKKETEDIERINFVTYYPQSLWYRRRHFDYPRKYYRNRYL